MDLQLVQPGVLVHIRHLVPDIEHTTIPIGKMDSQLVQWGVLVHIRYLVQQYHGSVRL